MILKALWQKKLFKKDDSLQQIINAEPSIEELDLSNKNIKNLSAEIGRLKNLKKLNLSNNNLEKIPSEVCNLSNLEELDLSNNKLKKIPPEIVKLINLKSLELYGNALEELSDYLLDLKNLIHFRAFENKLWPDDIYTKDLNLRLYLGWDYLKEQFYVQHWFDHDNKYLIFGDSIKDVLTNFSLFLDSYMNENQKQFKNLLLHKKLEFINFRNKADKFFENDWFRQTLIPDVINAKKENKYLIYKQCYTNKWEYSAKFATWWEFNFSSILLNEWESAEHFFTTLKQDWESYNELFYYHKKVSPEFILNSETMKIFFDSVLSKSKIQIHLNCLNYYKKQYFIEIDGLKGFYFQGESFAQVLNQLAEKLQYSFDTFKSLVTSDYFESKTVQDFFINKPGWKRNNILEFDIAEGGFKIFIDEYSKNDEYLHVLNIDRSEDIEGKYFFIDKNDIQKILTPLNSCPKLTSPRSGEGLDGITYNLKILRNGKYVKYNWWSDNAGKRWNGLYKCRNEIYNVIYKYTNISDIEEPFCF